MKAVWIVFLILTRLVAGELQSSMSAWMDHMKIVDRFPCNIPQPRSLRVSKLLKGRLESSEVIVPHMTVLHRCDSESGCCKDRKKECLASAVEDVYLHFYFFDTFKNEKGYRVLNLSNHTQCTCQDAPITNKI